MLHQHLIDPQICIRCNTCEETCPIGAITHDSMNYVVAPDVCEGCQACISPCPTGAIDSWRDVPRSQAYPVAEQLLWDELPAAKEAVAVSVTSPSQNAPRAPISAATPQCNLYGPTNPILAAVMGNYRVTDAGSASDTRHIVLNFCALPFPVLEGQSLGVIVPGLDAQGRPHHARQYSIASPRDGERPGYNNVALTVKRVEFDHDGRPARGLASNYLCDLQRGDSVQVVGPFGSTFLMPNAPGSHLLMICTGTGSAPMRAMTERRRRLHNTDSRLMLFFGARTRAELPYFGPLMNLPPDFIDLNFAFSRTDGGCYVQDRLRERAGTLLPLLHDPGTHIYVCGLKTMEAGVLQALADIVGPSWPQLANTLITQGRMHIEVY